MWQQKSFENEGQKGILYLVPTPIGNLEDMSFRAVRILKEADLIAAEDTRNTRKLLNYFDITTPVVSYHEHNKETSGKNLIEKIKDGLTIALVSDAGMPAISDPGYELVVAAVGEQLTVVPLPGANAGMTALIASGISCQPFYFYGFLNRNKKEKRVELEGLKHQQTTMIFYEAPHRLKETLLAMHEVLGNRQAAICRELTKKFEEFIRGDLKELLEWAEQSEIRGEFCVIIEGTNEESITEPEIEWWNDLTIEQQVDMYMSSNGMTSKDAIKQTAKDRGLNKREVYQIYHVQN